VQTRLVGWTSFCLTRFTSSNTHSRKISHTPEEILVKISGKTRIQHKTKEREKEEKTQKGRTPHTHPYLLLLHGIRDEEEEEEKKKKKHVFT